MHLIHQIELGIVSAALFAELTELWGEGPAPDGWTALAVHLVERMTARAPDERVTLLSPGGSC